MKKIYKVLRQGYEEMEVSDNFEVMIPYTEVQPLKLEESQAQIFSFTEKIWKEMFCSDVSEQLELVAVLYDSSQNKLNELENTVSQQEEEILATQLALAELYELGGV